MIVKVNKISIDVASKKCPEYNCCSPYKQNKYDKCYVCSHRFNHGCPDKPELKTEDGECLT